MRGISPLCLQQFFSGRDDTDKGAIFKRQSVAFRKPLWFLEIEQEVFAGIIEQSDTAPTAIGIGQRHRGNFLIARPGAVGKAMGGVQELGHDQNRK